MSASMATQFEVGEGMIEQKDDKTQKAAGIPNAMTHL